MHEPTRKTLERFRRVRDVCRGNPVLSAAFARVRSNTRKLSNPISVDFTSRCNLFCEGCYYYEGDAQAMRDESDQQKWVAFFKAEQARNTQFIYVGGAEAALHPERIRAAAECIPHGIIAANGTVRIAPDIPYRIAVSVWGNPKDTARLRGGGTFWKALRLYANDPRALFAYTINSKNIDQIAEVAEIMKAEGGKLTFNMYSPTESYLTKIAGSAPNDASFFRFSSKVDNLAFDDLDLARCHAVVDDLIDAYPDTIIYPKAFNHELTRPGPVFEIDPETGYALDCAGRHNGTHKTILSTLEESRQKCCMPNIDCVNCRLIATVLPSRLMPKESDARSEETVRDWLNICQYWAWFYLNEPYRPVVLSADMEAPEMSLANGQNRA